MSELKGCLDTLDTLNKKLGDIDLRNITYKESALSMMLDSVLSVHHCPEEPKYHLLKLFLRKLAKINPDTLDYRLRDIRLSDGISQIESTLYIYPKMSDFYPNIEKGDYYIKFEKLNKIWFLSSISPDLYDKYLSVV